jgi:hypothetical protein
VLHAAGDKLLGFFGELLAAAALRLEVVEVAGQGVPLDGTQRLAHERPQAS